MTRKLPVGIQSFEKIRRDGFAYVDKTSYVHRLAQAGVPCFLSRPRRFGKSLLVSTMRAYFEGKRELFTGLDIERLEGDGPSAWMPRPVFLLSFNGADYTREGGLEDKLGAVLGSFEEAWGCKRECVGYCFHPDGPVGGPARKCTNESPSAADSDSSWTGRGEGRRAYNPFSLLRALQSRRLGSYWFETGTPTFLAERMGDAGLDPRRLTDGSIYATERRLSDYRADDPDPVPLLFQAGYLTIRGLDAATGEYSLGVPNGEVEWGLLESLLPAWAPGYSESRGTDVFALRRLVEAGDAEGMRDVIAALFASIPYTKAAGPFENYFQAVLWLTFTLLGRYVACEVRQARDRVDCVVEARAHVFVIEFKREGTAAEALAQIEEKGYAAPFATDPRQLHLIGFAFDPETRLLADWSEA